MTTTPHRPDLPADQPGEPTPVEPQPFVEPETTEPDLDEDERRTRR